MSKAFRRLERVLRLEAQQGYQNKAVVGGIRKFATFWVEQARAEVAEEADKALVEQAAELLTTYDKLPGLEARAGALDGLMNRLKVRQERVGRQKPTRPEQKPKPKQKPSPPKKKAQQPQKKQERQRPAKKQPAPAKKYKPRKKVAPDPAGLAQSTTKLRGVGPSVAKKFSTLGAENIEDLLSIYPRRYDDYTKLKPINRLEYGEQVTIIGTVWETRARRVRGSKILTQTVISDGTGKIQATWYNQPWLADKLKSGLRIALSGKIDQYLGRLVLNSPEWEPLDEEMLRTNRIVPVYPLTKGLGSNRMRQVMKDVVDNWAPCVTDPLPDGLQRRQGLLSLPDALTHVHFPESHDLLHKSRQRLAFDELFLLQLGMLGQRRTWQDAPGRALPPAPPTLAQFTESLPYTLTGAQQRVVAEIAQDMSRAVPMNRLLQGDVGAGKTVVAASAMVIAVADGTQAALMAPTEILAEQHYQGLSALLNPLGITVRLLVGRMSAKDKEAVYAELADGTTHIAIGTHALIQEAVQFKNLALAVVDEQHRFGVDQRQALRDKGAVVEGSSNGHQETVTPETVTPETITPHVLVMSATPIPRTLALSIYGDLDVSVLDEMPPGREEITTKWIQPRARERAYAFVRGQVEQGRQAYIICPLVEDSDKIDAKSAVEEHARLQEQIFPDLKLGLLHGRLKGGEKESVMHAFKSGETNILVSTSVIEVGVDVPNSTVMLIEGANRFGLAQLHQFRGRVGRGQHQSYCLLVADNTSQEAEERLQALEKTNDGFLLAEKDLELRGPGQFFGRRQSGLPELHMASLLDLHLLERAREEAYMLFSIDPLLEKPQHQALHNRVSQFWEKAGDPS